MYDYRILQHQAFQKWFCFINKLEPVTSVLDIGCGMGVGYVDFFKDINFVGIDLAPQVIKWCKKKYNNPKHDFICAEITKSPQEKKFDLVFSQGTIDNTYDIDAFLKAVVNLSKNWIYITAYRGYFVDLDQHSYTYNKEQGVYYNDISPYATFATLKNLGCKNINIFPSPTRYDEIPFETVITAQVEK